LKKKKLLLHCCCAPCSSYVAMELSKEYDVTCLFYNPNIDVPGEYEKRKLEMEKLAGSDELKVIYGKHEPNKWLAAIRGYEQEPEGGKRCKICFEMRLAETARIAREMGFDFFATTLTVAPMKNALFINKTGEAVALKSGVSYLPSDFKKKDGYKKSVSRSNELGLYRQKFCGCSFSLPNKRFAPNVKK